LKGIEVNVCQTSGPVRAGCGLRASAVSNRCTQTQTTQSNNQSAMPVSDSKDWDSYVNQFIEAYFVAHPDLPCGKDGMNLTANYPTGALRACKEAKRLHAEKDRVSGFQESTLSERQRFEREYVASQIDADLFWIESAEWPFRCPQFYADAIDPDVYVSREYAPLEQRLKAYTVYAKAVPTAVEQIRKNLRTPLPKTFVNIGPQTTR